MPATTKIVAIGEELGIILPPETLRHLNASVGDTLYLTVRGEGIHLSAIKPNVMDSINRVMHEHRDVLKKLADS